MSISFEDAVTQLQTMFPALETDVIVAVLESNGGHMQRTVGQLLEIDVPADPQAAATASAPAAPPAPPKPPASSAAPRERASSSSQRRDSGSRHRSHRGSRPTAAAAAPATRRWRHPLPDDFLRVPGAGQPPMTSTSDDQLTHDLLLAQMMEDELFLEELRRHPDFAHYLEAEEEFFEHQHQGSGSGSRRRTAPAHGRPRTQSEARAAVQARGGTTGTSWTSKLSSMGDEMKRKFNAFAMKFKGRGGVEQGQDPMQYRSLLVDDGGDEDETEVLTGRDEAVQRRPVPGDTLAPAPRTAPAPAAGGRDSKKSE